MSAKEDLVRIQRFLAGEMDQTERTRFEDELGANSTLKGQFEDVKFVWDAASHYSVPQFDSAMAFATVRDQLHSRPTRTLFWRYAAVASVLVLIGLWGAMTFFNGPEMHHLYATEDMNMTLEDGTVIGLRKGAAVSYPVHFTGQSRVVEIEHGQVFFNVESNPDRPFRVEHFWADVRVTGTEFVISVDTVNRSYTLQVTEGSVRLEPGLTKQRIDVTAGAGYRFHADTRNMDILTGVDSNAISWITGELSFHNTPVDKVIDDLESHYQVKIDLKNSSAGQCRFTAPLPYRNVELPRILEVLATTFGMEVSSAGGHYVLTGGKCR